MEWIQSILDGVMANVAASLVLLVVGGMAGALGLLVFGLNYKQRIDALEARPSQPSVINHVHVGDSSAMALTGDVTEIRCLTQAEYDALATKGDKTLYLIKDA